MKHLGDRQMVVIDLLDLIRKESGLDGGKDLTLVSEDGALVPVLFGLELGHEFLNLIFHFKITLCNYQFI